MQSKGVKELETQPNDSQAKWGLSFKLLNRKGKDNDWYKELWQQNQYAQNMCDP